jgi:hypothetical protein
MAGRQISIVRPPGRVLIIPTLPALAAFLSTLLFLSVVVLVLAMLEGMQVGHNLLHPNPFIPYEALWPGQSIGSVADYARRTHKGNIPCYTDSAFDTVLSGLVVYSNYNYYVSGNHVVTCIGDRREDVFRQMLVTLANEKVRELFLFSDTLRQDTLTLYWGVPDAITRGSNGQSIFLHWNQETYTATATINEPDAMVSLVTLIAKD